MCFLLALLRGYGKPCANPQMSNGDDTDEIKSFQAHRLGTWAELIGASFLIRRKFEVFIHTGSQSICDLVAFQRRGAVGKLDPVLIDVKFVNLDLDRAGPKPLSHEQIRAGVVRMVVGADGAVVCEWDLNTKGRNRSSNEHTGKAGAKLSVTTNTAKDN